MPFQNDTAVNQQRLERIFALQQKHQWEVGRSTARTRRRKLGGLLDAVLRHRDDIRQAMYEDFRKPVFEVDAVEILPTTGAIRHARKYLGKWTSPLRAPTPLMFAGSTSWVRHEPKGVCLIISPWNFPFNLSLVPLVSAIAGGNTVVLKPSEMTPHSSAVMEKLLAEVFEEKEVAVVQGGVETAQALLELPFNHLFFTGSPAVGRVVMQAAARHLSSVTLELGGKCPTIIDETADLRTATRRIALAKWANCGQICTTCDYLLVHESRKTDLLQLLRNTLHEFAEGDPKQSASYTRIVNDQHFERVLGYLEDARQHGALIVEGGEHDASQNFIAPTILTEVPQDCLVMKEEIFGPLLPVIGYDNLEAAVKFINDRERPLTMNIFSRSRKHIVYILEHTRAGGTTINNTTMHFYNHDLPFGGVNNSGVGKSHGWYGFAEFTNARAVYRQELPSVLDLLTPPYTRWKEKLIGFAIRYL